MRRRRRILALTYLADPAHTKRCMYTRPVTANTVVLWGLCLAIVALLAVVALQLDAQTRTSNWNPPGFGHILVEGMTRDLLTTQHVATVLLAALILLGGRHWLLITARVAVFIPVAVSALWVADVTSAEAVPFLIALTGTLLLFFSYRLRWPATDGQ